MACEKMLVLCGPTYPTRLWCAWELLTLFSFMDSSEALQRVQLMVLDNDASCDVLSDLLNFHVDKAHCYDPNEEAKLRHVVDAAGKAHFNARIRAFAASCEKHRTSANSRACGA
eukprot:gnl/MRDRNA2_/MRDRNA2_502312_c0_seq1.p1 gnl/MRDRNA2_/MRDRNA2_502312_c0~~gnl/MRDRNA2_/MRDRNA2_502312_c0_seq1.p1  ORF type:complete len:114 (+),score=21.81 gnl/MRDRNA2_/MRDRNA2_502312_c0_seq1:166-507(+)